MSATQYTLSPAALATVQQDVAAGNYPAAYTAIANDLAGRTDDAGNLFSLARIDAADAAASRARRTLAVQPVLMLASRCSGPEALLAEYLKNRQFAPRLCENARL